MRIIFMGLLIASVAHADPITFDTHGGGWCAVQSGRSHSAVVCDESIGFVPKKRAELRQRIRMDLGARGGLKCVTIDLYNPAVPPGHVGRIVDTIERCF